MLQPWGSPPPSGGDYSHPSRIKTNRTVCITVDKGIMQTLRLQLFLLEGQLDHPMELVRWFIVSIFQRAALYRICYEPLWMFSVRHCTRAATFFTFRIHWKSERIPWKDISDNQQYRDLCIVSRTGQLPGSFAIRTRWIFDYFAKIFV